MYNMKRKATDEDKKNEAEKNRKWEEEKQRRNDERTRQEYGLPTIPQSGPGGMS